MARTFIRIAGEAKWLVNDSILEASAFENLATGHGINRCSGFVAGEGKQQKRNVAGCAVLVSMTCSTVMISA